MTSDVAQVKRVWMKPVKLALLRVLSALVVIGSVEGIAQGEHLVGTVFLTGGLFGLFAKPWFSCGALFACFCIGGWLAPDQDDATKRVSLLAEQSRSHSADAASAGSSDLESVAGSTEAMPNRVIVELVDAEQTVQRLAEEITAIAHLIAELSAKDVNGADGTQRRRIKMMLARARAQREQKVAAQEELERFIQGIMLHQKFNRVMQGNAGQMSAGLARELEMELRTADETVGNGF